MAGVGPYGIEQVDVPGVLGAAQAMQGNRIKMMMEQKQLQMMDRQMAIQSGMMKMGSDFINRVYGNGGSGGASTGASDGAATPSGPSPDQVSSAMATAATPPAVGPITAANAAGQPAPVPGAPAAPPSAGTMGSSLNMPPQSITSRAAPMLGMMGFLNPDQAQAMGNVFEKMDAASATQWKQKNAAIVNEFAGLLQLPVAQRRAAIQQNMGDLQQLGYTPQQIAGFDPTDANIRMEIGKHADADKVMDMVNPHFENMRANGAVAQINPDMTSSIPARSPLLQGPHGNLYPNQIPGAPTATDAKGNKIQYNAESGQWEPIGGQTPPASGNFP